MKRTTQQNSAYWLWLTHLAESLNDAGFCVNDRVAIPLDVPYTKDNLHDICCKPYLHALYPDKTSTTELSTAEMQQLYTYVDQAISSRTGCHVEFPSEESLYLEGLSREQ